MSFALRGLLLIGALFMAVYIFKEIRSSQMRIEDALFWILTALLFVLLGVFPGIAIHAAVLIGVQSPANLVFLVAIFLLLVKCFSLTKKVSMLEHKLQYFAQTYAIDKRSAEKESAAPGFTTGQ